MNEKIDFVIMWVDGSDPKWLEEKNKYLDKKIDTSNAINSVSDSEIKDMLSKASNVFQGNISKILNILNEGGNNE